MLLGNAPATSCGTLPPGALGAFPLPALLASDDRDERQVGNAEVCAPYFSFLTDSAAELLHVATNVNRCVLVRRRTSVSSGDCAFREYVSARMSAFRWTLVVVDQGDLPLGSAQLRHQ